jgi:hypothetical protein
MTINELAAIGEIVGAIGVVASLIYLTVQIRQNTHAMDEGRRLAPVWRALGITGGRPSFLQKIARLEQEELNKSNGNSTDGGPNGGLRESGL